MIALLKQHTFFSGKTIDSCTLLENQGYCNENYLLLANGKKHIVRKLLRNDIDRDFEWEVQQLAFQQGITAEPLVLDKVNNFMVFEFLEGEHKRLELQTSVPQNWLTLLAQTVQKLHAITINAKPIKINIENKSNEVQMAFETIAKYDRDLVLCHNDLNPQNIFFSKEVKLIDWEYAGVNDRYFDLACICVEFGLDEKDQDYFLSHYDDGKTIIYEKLEAYKTIYIALCKQWFENN